MSAYLPVLFSSQNILLDINIILTAVFCIYVSWLVNPPDTLPIKDKEEENESSLTENKWLALGTLEKSISILEETVTIPSISEDRRKTMEVMLKDLSCMYSTIKNGENNHE